MIVFYKFMRSVGIMYSRALPCSLIPRLSFLRRIRWGEPGNEATYLADLVHQECIRTLIH